MKNRSYSSLVGSRHKGMESLQDELQQKVDSLQSELELTILRRECKKHELKAQELQERLSAYEEKERIIADVLLNAQSEARKVENLARERVRQMEARLYEDIRRKAEELADLRARMDDFMEEILQMLQSLEYALTSSDSAHLQNPILFAGTDFCDDCKESSLPDRDRTQTGDCMNDPAGLNNPYRRFHFLASTANPGPGAKIQPLRIVPGKKDND